jgi:hypothetical protein
MARLLQGIIESEVAQIERAMALGTATTGYQTQTTQMPMPMPWHGMAAADARRSKPKLLNAEQPISQQSAEFDEHKLPNSNTVGVACAFFSVSMGCPFVLIYFRIPFRVTNLKS